MMYLWIIVIVIGLMILSSMIRILKEYERGVVFRLGRLIGIKGPGLVILIPMVDRMIKVSLRVVTHDVPPQEIITRDNVSVKVNAVAYFRPLDPGKAITQVENYLYATSQVAQTTLRSVLGEYELDQLLSERDKINPRLQRLIDEQTDPWGVKVSMVEIKHVELPETMLRAIARQAEAERERRAKIIHAAGEFKAAEKLERAANILSKTPSAMQLRFLQTLTDVAAEKNSTLVFPVPIDLLTPYLQKREEKKRD